MSKERKPRWVLIRAHIGGLGLSRRSYDLLTNYGFGNVHDVVSASTMLPEMCGEDKEIEQEITDKTLMFLGGKSWEEIKAWKEYQEDAETRRDFVKYNGLAKSFTGLTMAWLRNRTGHRYESNLACIRKTYPQFINFDAIQKAAAEDNWPEGVWEEICLLYFGEVKDRNASGSNCGGNSWA